jgi:hypothetical protein
LNSLTELKNIIQSFNEAVTDNGMNTFQKQLSKLERQYEKKTAMTSLLKMMHSLGKYLDSKKNNAHPDSIPVLNSIASQLDKLINTPDLKKSETNRILSREIQKYNCLKNKIASNPAINDSDINDLKAVILAIDWEISDTTLQNFEKVVTNLLSTLKSYKIHHTFLKIIYSTGRYIGSQKANAHTDSISFLRSVFENFEQIVQTPKMAFKEKKQLLAADINRFHEFKHKISRKKDLDEPILPALSHIKSTTRPATEKIASLTTLPEPEDRAFAEDGSDPGMAGPRDVMDDLFSIKDSPADELLDAIHLMNVHGSNQGQALNMLDQTNDRQPDGIKNFIPQRMDNDPLPEIKNRLDEFFSLDAPQDNTVVTDDRENQTLEIGTMTGDSPAEGIIPFQYEDESFEETLHKSDDGPLPQDYDPDILTRLKSSVETLEWFKDESSMLSINQDIAYLEKRWRTDPDKTCLLEIIVSIIKVLKNQPERVRQKNNDSITHESDKPMGMWGKIKQVFFS